jgi:hypothetical protein
MSYEDIPPEVMQELLAEYAASQGDPSMMTGEEQNLYGAIPSYDLEGDPYSLTQQLNQLQDFNQLIADPVMQSLGGVGAWSQQAFQPEVQWEQVDSPEYRRWRNYLNTPESFEGMIAAEIAEGGTPYSAMQKIQARIMENPTGPLAQELGMNFGQPDYQAGGYLKDEAGNPMIDWPAAAEAATKIDELRAAIPDIGPGGPVTAPDGTVVPGAGEIVEVDGQLLRRTEVPSPLMEKFQELGLPSPYEEYTPEMFMGPEWAAGREEWEAGNQTEALDQAMRDAYQQMLDAQNAPPRPPSRVSPDYEPTIAAEEPDYDPLSSGWPGSGRSISQEGVQNTATVAQPEGAPLAPSTDMLDVIPGGQGMPQGSVQPAPGTPAAAVSEVIAYGDDETLAAWMDSVYPTLSPQDQAEVDVVVGSNGGPPPPATPSAWEQLQIRGATPTPEAPPANIGNFSGSPFAPNISAPSGGGGEMAQGFMGPTMLGGLDPAALQDAMREVISRGDFDASQTPGASFFPTGEPPDEPTPLEVLLGMAPEEELPPLDPNAPVMEAAGGVGPTAPPRPEPVPINVGNFSGSPFAPNMPAPRTGLGGTPGYVYGAGRYNEGLPQAETSSEQKAYLDYLAGGMMRGEVPPYPFQEYQQPLTGALNYPMGRNATPEQLQAIYGTPAGPEPISMNYPLGRDVPPDVRNQILGQSDRTPQPAYVYGGRYQYPDHAAWEAAQGGQPTPMERVVRPIRDPEAPLGGGALPTGERPRRQSGGAPPSEFVPSTEADRDAMRRWLSTGEEQENVPEGVQQWLTNAQRTGWREDPERKVFGAAVRKANKYRMQRGVERQQIYGSDWGSAVRAVYEAQRQGASPLQQALAQRVQNIRTAGAQVGASPRVVGW